MHYRSMTKLIGLFTALMLMMPSASMAADYRGKIMKVTGEVHVINEKGEIRKVEQSKFLIREMDTIVTKDGSNAVVQFNDGALSILDEKSSLLVEKKNWFSHVGGKIYFAFRKVFGQKRQVKSKFATIGIRGTTFIINDDESGQSVALEEGMLDIESPGAEYEIHRQRVVDDFEAFKKQQQEAKEKVAKEFKEYKEKITEEFIEYKKNFTLQENHVISFDGNRVDEVAMTEDAKAQFSNFEAIAEGMIEEYRNRPEENQSEEELSEDDQFN